MTPVPSEGADAAVDDLIADVQAWIGQLRELQLKATRTARLCNGTPAAAKASSAWHAIHSTGNFPRALTTLRTTAQQARDTASARATSDAVGVVVEQEAERTRAAFIAKGRGESPELLAALQMIEAEHARGRL